MVDTDKDSLTRLNTQLNRSMVLMDHNTNDDEVPLHRSTKTIKINTKIQPASPSNGTHNVSRKSILKKTSKSPKGNGAEDSWNIENELERLNNETQRRLSMNTPKEASRPLNIQDLVEREGLVKESKDSTLTLDDFSENVDIWILDIPKTINPQDLKGQVLTLGAKSKLNANEERYCAVKYDPKSDITCVLKSGNGKDDFKTVKIKPAGGITIRRKLTSYHKMKPITVDDTTVPFPKNLKTRHPLFGANPDGKIRKRK